MNPSNGSHASSQEEIAETFLYVLTRHATINLPNECRRTAPPRALARRSQFFIHARQMLWSTKTEFIFYSSRTWFMLPLRQAPPKRFDSFEGMVICREKGYLR
jgi:hypothetical protein